MSYALCAHMQIEAAINRRSGYEYMLAIFLEVEIASLA